MVQKLPVGLLWDSVSDNTGDKAIGIVARGFCESRGLDYEVLDPFSYDPARYSIILVGGGELIRKRGDPFYDCFRVQGPHILNAAGLFQPDNVDYLRDYRLVAVRSEAERHVLQDRIPNVKARTCIATLMGEFCPRQLASPRSQLPPRPRPDIGVHLHWGLLESVPNVLDGLRAINEVYHLTLVPFTLYNHDYELLGSLARLLPDASVSEAREPVDIYYSISCLDGMITSSLHASIFAIMQNVPVVAFPYAPKVLYHLEDRGLRSWAFGNVTEMVQKVTSPDFLMLDYTAIIEQDLRSAHEHLDEVKCIVDEQQSRTPATVISYPPRIDRTEQGLTYYKTLMHFLALVGDLRAQLLESQALAAEQERQLSRIIGTQAWRSKISLRSRQLFHRALNIWREVGVLSLIRKAWHKLVAKFAGRVSGAIRSRQLFHRAWNIWREEGVLSLIRKAWHKLVAKFAGRVSGAK